MRDPSICTSHDSAASSCQVKTKDALYIKREIPTLNRQLIHLDFSPSFDYFSFLFILFNFLVLFQLLLASAHPLFSARSNIQIVNVNFTA